MKTRTFPALVLSFIVLVIFASIANAANCRVTKAADTNDGSCDVGDCSLREAVAEPACTAIDFSLDLVGTPVLLTSGEIVIDRNLSITGYGADAITISGNNTSRIFYLTGGATVNISRVALKNGNGVGTGPDNGGAIRINGATLNLDGAFVTGNSSTGYGGGISFELLGQGTITNSTISNNTSVNEGSAVSSRPSFTGVVVKINNSTITGHTGSALFVLGGFLRMTNSTVAGNGTRGVYVEITSTLDIGNSIVQGICKWSTTSTITSRGSNVASTDSSCNPITYDITDIVGHDPALGPLQYNRGHTPTMALIFGSLAMERGNNNEATNEGLTTDQRGHGRIYDADGDTAITVDAGAYEYGASPASTVTVAGRILGGVSGNPVRSQTVAITDLLGNTRTTLSSSLGWFVFDGLPAGFVYRVSVKGRRGVQQKTIFADQNMSDVDILVPGV